MTIKEARKALGMTRQEMAECLQIPKKTIANWESGDRNPPDYVERLVVEKLQNMKQQRMEGLVYTCRGENAMGKSESAKNIKDKKRKAMLRTFWDVFKGLYRALKVAVIGILCITAIGIGMILSYCIPVWVIMLFDLNEEFAATIYALQIPIIIACYYFIRYIVRYIRERYTANLSYILREDAK